MSRRINEVVYTRGWQSRSHRKVNFRLICTSDLSCRPRRDFFADLYRWRMDRVVRELVLSHTPSPSPTWPRAASFSWRARERSNTSLLLPKQQIIRSAGFAQGPRLFFSAPSCSLARYFYSYFFSRSLLLPFLLYNLCSPASRFSSSLLRIAFSRSRFVVLRVYI